MKNVKWMIDVVLYVVMFLLVQLVMTYLVTAIDFYSRGIGLQQLIELAQKGQLMPSATGLVWISVASSVVTFVLFLVCRWAAVSRSYVRSRPWTVVAWVVVLALGTLIPSEMLEERLPFEMPVEIQATLAEMMHNRWGYLAIGILAPLTEELVFRGAILRTLLRCIDRRWHWVAIVVSALLFGGVHLNMPQFIHATLIGLLLGWMYYRTDSIVPGVVFHWVNNTAAYVVANLIPNAENAELVDIFSGQQQAVWMALGCSLCLFLPALFQLAVRLKKADE